MIVIQSTTCPKEIVRKSQMGPAKLMEVAHWWPQWPTEEQKKGHPGLTSPRGEWGIGLGAEVRLGDKTFIVLLLSSSEP